MEEPSGSNRSTSYYELGHHGAPEWLQDPAPIDDESLDQDFDIMFPGTLDGGIVGHLRFYIDEPIPNPAKKLFLLNSIYVLTWTRIGGLFGSRGWRGFFRWRGPVVLPPEFLEAIALAHGSVRPELGRWAADVLRAVDRQRRLNYRFWCDGGWKK